MSRLFEAIAFAAEAHEGQTRKGNRRIPYIHHPMEVGKILLAYDFSDEVAMAGYLHDTLEDTPVTEEEIRERFGERVAGLVVGASEPAELVKGNFGDGKKAPWQTRKEHTIHYLGNEAADEVVAICCADKLSNLRDMRRDYTRIGESFWEAFRGSREKQLWYFQSLSEIFKRRLSAKPVDSLYGEFQNAMDAIFDHLK